MLISVNHCFFIDQNVSSAAIILGITTAILLCIVIFLAILERHGLQQKLAVAYQKLRGQCRFGEQRPLIQDDNGSNNENHQSDRDY